MIFYLISKVHKNLISTKSIYDAYNYCTTYTSKAITITLNKIYKFIKTELKDTDYFSIYTFTDKVIKNLKLQKTTNTNQLNYYSFDFKSIYPNLNTKNCIK